MVPSLLAFVCANELVATAADYPYIFPAKNAYFVLPYMCDLQHVPMPVPLHGFGGKPLNLPRPQIVLQHNMVQPAGG